MAKATSRGTSRETTYSMGAVSRLTGLSPHVLRAWERRYEAVRPVRTAGGTRRYREADVARLHLLRAAVEAGHPIGEIVNLSDRELKRRASSGQGEPTPPIQPVVEALDRLDWEEVDRVLSLQLAALGPRRFVRAVAAPLLREIGDRWEKKDLCVAAEHLASVIVRTLVGGALRPVAASLPAPPIVFTTLSGEPHEFGTLMAAVTAAGVGGNAVYLGPNLPVQEIAHAAQMLRARAVAIGVSSLSKREGDRALQALRCALSSQVEIWVGGAGSERLRLPGGVQMIADLDALERKVALLGFRPAENPW